MFKINSHFTIGVIKYQTTNPVQSGKKCQTRDHQLFWNWEMNSLINTFQYEEKIQTIKMVNILANVYEVYYDVR